MSALVDPQLERAFLGACFMEPSFVLTSSVLPHQLTTPSRARIFGAMLGLAQKGATIDTLAVRTELVRRGVAAECDDELLAATNTIHVPAEWMPRRLRELAQARDGRERAMRAIGAWDAGRLEEALAEMRAGVGALDPVEDDARGATVGQLVEEAAIEARKANEAVAEGRPVAITTGLPELDALLGDAPHNEAPVIGGWEPGDYVVIGGDTNVGKSSVAMTMAWGAATGRDAVPVGIVQVEDPRGRVAKRSLSLASEIPQHRIRSGRLSDAQWARVERAVEAAKSVPMFFEFRVGGSLPAVCAALRRLRRERGCRVIVVDYLQAVETHEDPRLAMRNIVAATKREAARGEGPASVVIGLSQLRKRDDETARPKRSDLYESAYLAQKAEHIVLMHKTKSGSIELTLDKTKDGRTGRSFQLVRDPDTGRLVDADAEGTAY